MARWIFLRHGESVANAEGFLSGHRDVPLTSLGEAQARAAGAALSSEALHAVLVSDLRRARQTADLALGDWAQRRGEAPPAPRFSAALRERHLGSWEGAIIAELRRDGRAAVLTSWDERPPGGESLCDLALRSLPLLVQAERAGTTLLVAHGGLIRVLVGLLDGVPTAVLGREKIANAAPLAREVPPGTWATLLSGLSASGPTG